MVYLYPYFTVAFCQCSLETFRVKIAVEDVKIYSYCGDEGMNGVDEMKSCLFHSELLFLMVLNLLFHNSSGDLTR